MKIFGQIALLAFLSGCAGHPMDCATGLVAWNDCPSGTAGFDKRLEHQKINAARCIGYGYAEGTPAYSDCLMKLDQSQDAANEALLRSVLGGSHITSPPLFNNQTTTTTCVSAPVGTNVITSCK